MNILPEYLEAIQRLGYAEHEARFLYLVATHSGYFTLRQYLKFTDKTKGCAVHHFTTKTTNNRHARPTEYGRKTYVYNLYSRSIYGGIEKDNLRNRRRQSNELIHVRLLILDFVLAHPDHQYLETEADKVAYFHDTLHIPLPVLPGRIYKGSISNSHTKRYFVDRFPVFFPSSGVPLSLRPPVTLTYCDSGRPSLAPFLTHLRAYEKFLRRLPAFNFVYASPSPAKFPRAANFFYQLFAETGRVNSHHLARYFHVRRLWDGNDHASLTRADRDLLREGDRRYQGEPFESAFRKWLNQGLSETDLDALCGPPQARHERSFHTYVLPEDYDIFYHEAGARYRTSSRNGCSASRSVSRSAACAS